MEDPLYRKRLAACHRQIPDPISRLRLRDAVQVHQLETEQARGEGVSKGRISLSRPIHECGWAAVCLHWRTNLAEPGHARLNLLAATSLRLESQGDVPIRQAVEEMRCSRGSRSRGLDRQT